MADRFTLTSPPWPGEFTPRCALLAGFGLCYYRTVKCGCFDELQRLDFADSAWDSDVGPYIAVVITLGLPPELLPCGSYALNQWPSYIHI